MALVQYNPVFGELQGEINRLFNHWGDESTGATAGWTPNVDIQEFADRFRLFVDLPGVDPNDVEITLDNSVLTVTGERTMPAVQEGEKVLHRRSERGHGRFHRRFTLPDTVDAERVEATDKNGVLEISIPKQAKAQPRRITIAA